MKEIEKRLLDLQDLNYRDFHSRLMPDYDKDRIIGVRTPELRRLAKDLAKAPEAETFLGELPHKYYEENNLHAYMIPHMARDFDQAMELTEAFLPYVDNWATCDTFIVKQFKQDLDRLFLKCLQWLKSDHVYTVRYGIVTQLNSFLDENFRPEMLDIIGDLNREEYYINMAVAWYYSFALIKQYEKTIPIFEGKNLDKWIHNKSLQKAIESYRIDKETKDYLRSLKMR